MELASRREEVLPELLASSIRHAALVVGGSVVVLPVEARDRLEQRPGVVGTGVVGTGVAGDVDSVELDQHVGEHAVLGVHGRFSHRRFVRRRCFAPGQSVDELDRSPGVGRDLEPAPFDEFAEFEDGLLRCRHQRLVAQDQGGMFRALHQSRPVVSVPLIEGLGVTQLERRP